jgi:hypothetical protein
MSNVDKYDNVWAIFSPDLEDDKVSVYIGYGNWMDANTNLDAWLEPPIGEVGAVLFNTERDANMFVSKYNLEDCKVENVGDFIVYWFDRD